MPEAKPFSIAKRLVWEAYERVKANRGAAGVDGQSLAAFEEDLKGNLYKIWNRMSSASYIPPPVRLVEIPKGDGKLRPLGIPTVHSYHSGSDRVVRPSWPICSCIMRLTSGWQGPSVRAWGCNSPALLGR